MKLFLLLCSTLTGDVPDDEPSSLMVACWTHHLLEWECGGMPEPHNVTRGQEHTADRLQPFGRDRTKLSNASHTIDFLGLQRSRKKHLFLQLW